MARPRYKVMGLEWAPPTRLRIVNLELPIPILGRRIREKREIEFDRAFDEGKELIIRYDLKTALCRTTDNSKYINDIRELKILVEDPRVVMDVPNDIFPKIVSDKKIPYVCEEIGDHADKTVWATTENKLRIRTAMGKGNPFYGNIIFPSYVAQLIRQVDFLAGQETTPEEIMGLDKKAGFTTLDMSTTNLHRVKKITLLSPSEADNFKSGVPLYNLRKDLRNLPNPPY